MSHLSPSGECRYRYLLPSLAERASTRLRAALRPADVLPLLVVASAEGGAAEAELEVSIA